MRENGVKLKIHVCIYSKTKLSLPFSPLQKEWREDRHGAFKRKVARCVRKSQETAFE